MRPVWILLALVLLPLTSLHAFADKRVALLIGNATYVKEAQLFNPLNDVGLMKAALTGAGFDIVEVQTDLNRAGMLRALRTFEDATQDADIGVIFYSGHGIELNGQNYLVPVDARLVSDRDIADEAVSLDRVLDALDAVKRLKLVLLDACRDNPFGAAMKRVASRGVASKGLARIEAVSSTNMLIAYAAAPGQIASDGEGANSPFTTALAKRLVTPGLDVELALRQVRDDVLAATGQKQQPYKTGSLGGDTLALSKLTPKIDTDISRNHAEPPADLDAAARADFALAKQIGSTAAWDVFLAHHKEGFLADLAKAEAQKLQKSLKPVAALEPPPVESAPVDRTFLKDAQSLEEVRERLYELNFDLAPFKNPYDGSPLAEIREFEQQNNLEADGVASLRLLKRLREIDGLKPWGAIVYQKRTEKWGMAWGENTRKDAVAHAQASCGDVKGCASEISFFGARCGVFAHSRSSWAITMRDDIEKAKIAALADCQKRGKMCQIIASVCADGSNRFSAAK
jgi:hypothetical protein